MVDTVIAKPGPKSDKPRSKANTVANGQQEKRQEKATGSKSTGKLPVPDDAMEVDQGESEVNVQTTSRSTTAGTSNIHSFSEVKSRRELDRWKQKAKDVRSRFTPLLFGA